MPPRTEPQAALGRAIRELRHERELSQEELAHRAELHATWLSHIEAGRVNPAWGTVRRIAAGLGVRVSELSARAEAIEADGDAAA
jgi:transcriptional regulator with XRE-family HTH domain